MVERWRKGRHAERRHSKSKGVEVGSTWVCDRTVRRKSQAQGERKWPQEFREISFNRCSGTRLTGSQVECVFDIVSNREL